MQSEIKKDMKKNYLILQQENEEKTTGEKNGENGGESDVTGLTVSGLSTEFYLKMMLNNEIPGLLEFELRVINNKSHYYYDVTGLKTLEAKAAQGNFTHEQLREILGQMIDIIEEGKEYFLKEGDYILGEKYMYWSEARKKLSLCYYPNYNSNIQEQIKDFTIFLMNHINYQEEAAVIMVYGFNKISTQEDCSFEKFKEVLDKRQRKAESPKESVSRDREKIREQMQLSLKRQQEEQEKREEVKREERRRNMSICMSFLGLLCLVLAGIFLYRNIVLGRLGKFVMAAAAVWGLGFLAVLVWIVVEIRKYGKFVKDCAYYCLVSEGECEEGEREIRITDFPCYIGKSMEQNRIVIYNQAVSRRHALIDKEEGRYFLTDLHSTNGTYLNHLRIPPEQKVPIQESDEISFADVSYRFRMKSFRMPLHY